jgi:DNA invertase Pin-like site-specific DNA recombinase
MPRPCTWHIAGVKTKAFSYLRVSGKGQIEGDGFPRQREAIQRYARHKRIEIAAEYRDEGVSGTKDHFDRPGLTDLLVAIKSNGVRLVLVERADRLARDLMVGEIILAEFRSLGVQVITADSGTDLTVEDDDPTRTLMRQMLGAIAQWEKSIIVQKLRAARVRIRRDKGRCEGRKPYGVNQHEQEVIGKVRQMRRDGLSFTKIAKALNETGVSPRKATRAGQSTKWHPPMVQRMLARIQSKPNNA